MAEPAQRIAQRDGAVEVVEGEHPLAPARTGQPLGLLGQELGAGRDHEHVVVQPGPVGELHLVRGRFDAVAFRDAELDSVMQLSAAGTDDLVRAGEPARDEQESRLVEVPIVAVDHHDLRRVAIGAAQPVRDERPAGAGAEDDDAWHGVTVPALSRRRIRVRRSPRCG